MLPHHSIACVVFVLIYASPDGHTHPHVMSPVWEDSLKYKLEEK